MFTSLRLETPNSAGAAWKSPALQGGDRHDARVADHAPSLPPAAGAGAGKRLQDGLGPQRRSYLYAKTKLAKVDGGVMEFVHADHLGSGIIWSSQAGAVMASSRQLPFGAQLGGTSSETDFAGKKKEVATALDYFGARFYHPEVGRFSAADPVRRIRVSQYAYADGNPLTRIDAAGLEPVPIEDEDTAPPPPVAAPTQGYWDSLTRHYGGRVQALIDSGSEDVLASLAAVARVEDARGDALEGFLRGSTGHVPQFGAGVRGQASVRGVGLAGEFAYDRGGAASDLLAGSTEVARSLSLQLSALTNKRVMGGRWGARAGYYRATYGALPQSRFDRGNPLEGSDDRWIQSGGLNRASFAEVSTFVRYSFWRMSVSPGTGVSSMIGSELTPLSMGPRVFSTGADAGLQWNANGRGGQFLSLDIEAPHSALSLRLSPDMRVQVGFSVNWLR